MRIFQHRINTSEALLNTPTEYGIELDLRPNGNDIILHHDPFVDGENFEDFLKNYNHSGIILNTKAEGMEQRLIQLMDKYNVSDYFFLDLSLPFLIKTVKSVCKKVAVRFSEYEPIEFVSKFEGLAEWVWVDCFTANILNSNNFNYLKKHFKICIVSPELQGHPIEWIADFKNQFANFEIDAVCTKKPSLWL
jgi:hypothetical protein